MFVIKDTVEHLVHLGKKAKLLEATKDGCDIHVLGDFKL